MKSIALLIFGLIISGCVQDDNPVKIIIHPTIWPLNDGNQWVYTEIEYDSSSVIKDISKSGIGPLRDTIMNNELWFYSTPGGAMMTNRFDGLYLLLLDENNVYSPELNFPYPSKRNQIYYGKYLITTVLSTDTLITINNIDYHCYTYLNTYYYKQSELDVISYCTPTVGLLRRELYSKYYGGNRYLSATSELESYSLK